MDKAVLVSRLTQMEQRVANEVLSGRANKWIADDFTLSQRTVEAHRAQVFQKMRVRNALELTRILRATQCTAERHIGPVWFSNSEIGSTSG